MAQPWDRKKGESEQAYEAFLRYRDLGPVRAKDPVYTGLAKSRQLISRWANRWEWEDRVTAWDNHLQRERDKVAAKEAAKWEARRQQHVERTWQSAQVLRDKVDKMLAFPLQRTRTEQDGKTIVIEPARWTFQAASTILKAAVEMEAAALLAMTKDPAEMDDAEAGATAEEPGEG